MGSQWVNFVKDKKDLGLYLSTNCVTSNKILKKSFF